MAPTWNGSERRSNNDHDLLTEIHTDVKHLRRTSEQYGEDIGTLKTEVVTLKTIQQQNRSSNSNLTTLAAVAIAGIALVKSFWK